MRMVLCISAGMLLRRSNFVQQGADAAFRGCTSLSGAGGGLAVLRGSLLQLAGSLSFDHCSSGTGGGLFVKKDVLMADAMSFRNCNALRKGWSKVVDNASPLLSCYASWARVGPWMGAAIS